MALTEDGKVIEWGHADFGGDAGQKLNGKNVICIILKFK